MATSTDLTEKLKDLDEREGYNIPGTQEQFGAMEQAMMI